MHDMHDSRAQQLLLLPAVKTGVRVGSEKTIQSAGRSSFGR